MCTCCQHSPRQRGNLLSNSFPLDFPFIFPYGSYGWPHSGLSPFRGHITSDLFLPPPAGCPPTRQLHPHAAHSEQGVTYFGCGRRNHTLQQLPVLAQFSQPLTPLSCTGISAEEKWFPPSQTYSNSAVQPREKFGTCAKLKALQSCSGTGFLPHQPLCPTATHTSTRCGCASVPAGLTQAAVCLMPAPGQSIGLQC